MTNLLIGFALGYIINHIRNEKQLENKLDEVKGNYNQALENMKQYYEAKADKNGNTTPTARTRIGFASQRNDIA